MGFPIRANKAMDDWGQDSWVAFAPHELELRCIGEVPISDVGEEVHGRVALRARHHLFLQCGAMKDACFWPWAAIGV
ncbi:MAG: hypothetical protein ACI9EF_001400 [Pseudohongiellaceae bacterium]|jgi:hypothetical protein